MLTYRATNTFFVTKNITKSFVRNISIPKGHDEPPELAPQWLVKQDPSIHHCSLACISKICPKPSFFPRFKKVEVPAEVYSCKRKPKKMTLYEYFSYLLPDSMTAAKPEPKTCRKLLQLRQDICLNPQEWACCDVACMKEPKEWYGQATVNAIITDQPVLSEPITIKPCAPPDHMVPRCVVAKKGDSPTKETATCYPNIRYREPYSDIKGFSELSDSDVHKYKCRYKCYEDIPKIHEKSLKLACRWYSEYKDVNCPQQMFTRYKSIKISSKGDIEPTTAKTLHKPFRRIEIRKGVCGPQTLLRPRGIRNFSTSSNQLLAFKSDGIDPKDSIIKNLVKHRKSQPQPGQDFINSQYLKFQAGFQPDPVIEPERLDPPYLFPPVLDKIIEKTEEEKAKVPTKPLHYTTRNSPYNPDSIKDKFDSKRSTIFTKVKLFSTSATSLKDEKGKKGKEKTPQICSGCPGVRQALGPQPKAVSLYARKCRKRSTGLMPKKSTIFENIKPFSTSATVCKKITELECPQICGGCLAVRRALGPQPSKVSNYMKRCRKRPAGKCRVQDRELGFYERPITSPYYKCKLKLKGCNLPRDPPPQIWVDKTLPCQSRKDLH